MKKYKKLIITTTYLFLLNIVFSLMIYKTLTFSYIIFYFLESTLFSSIVNLISYPFKEKLKKNNHNYITNRNNYIIYSPVCSLRFLWLFLLYIFTS